MRERTLIGWNEYVDLPEWGVRNLRAKIDTGARTSALHVENIQVLPRGRVRFDVVVHRKKRDRHVHVAAPVTRRARVKSSNGQFEYRYFVTTRLRLGPVEKDIEISLVDRGEMIHRMLLGRSALGGDFLIDVSRRHVLDRPRRKKKKKKSASRR
jgi:hypothetical protein